MKIINNAGYDKDTAPKIITDKVYIYRPQNEDDWCYSHHQFITYFNGRFYSMWSSGRKHEDVQGQRVMFSSSEDALHWDTPYPLLDSTMGDYLEVTLTACGFYVYEGTLHAFIGQYEYDTAAILPVGHAMLLKDTTMFPSRTHKNTRLLVMSSTDGKNFCEPKDTGLPIVSNHPPQALHSGRILLSGNVMFPYSDDKTGTGNWKKAGIYPESMEDKIYDDSEGLEIVKVEKGWATHHCEGSFYQLSNGTINMMLRSEREEDNTCFLYCSQSFDNGENWSQPFKTEFTNDITKFHFGTLPDGRYYYIGNPTVLSSIRCPLVLSLSENGIDFNKHFIIEDQIHTMRFKGLYKGGIYGYPHSLIHNNKMYVIYSINKEDVAVSSFLLDGL